MLNEQELQWAVGLARDVYEICLKSSVTEQERTRFLSYNQTENLAQGVREGQLFVFGAFENHGLAAVGAVQNDGLLTMLAVHPMCQHHGMGSALLQTMCEFMAARQVQSVTAYIAPVTAASFFYQRGFGLTPNGALGDGYAVVACGLNELPQKSSIRKHGIHNKKPDQQRVTYMKRKISSKVVLAATAIVLILSLSIVSTITVHHLWAEKMYTAQDVYGAVQ